MMKSRDHLQASQRFRLQTEASRERDVFRHLHAWSHEHRCTALHRNAFPSGGRGNIDSATAAERCPDTTLVALAQLCCHRLRARRCFVTLISSSTEYILAEASKTTSLQYDTVEDARDTPWLGTCSFLREEGLGSIAIDGWRRARTARQAPAEEGFYYTEDISGHYHIVSDVRRAAAYAQYGSVRHDPQSVCFYAAIPLRAATGTVLGSLAIVDDAPRFGLSAAELDFFEDVADTVAQHLDAVVVRSQRQRSERLIQSLGLFNSGKSSLRQWWLTQEDQRNATAGRHTKSKTKQQREEAGHQEFGIQVSSSSSTGGSGRTHDEAASAGSDSDSDPDSSSKLNLEHSEGDLVTSSAATVRNEDAGTARKRAQISTQDFASGAKAPSMPAPKLLLDSTSRAGLHRQKTVPMPDGSDFDLDTANRHTYGRAANLIRQALGADGVVIVNANAVHAKKRSAISSLWQESSTSSDKSRPQSVSENETSEDSTSNIEKHCMLEAFSTRDASSLRVPQSSQTFNISEAFLPLLVRRYPNGKIFNFSSDGICCSSSNDDSAASGSNSETVKSARVPRDGRRLGRVMVGAKTIAFFPIWDETQDKWSSGIFVWCTAPLRYFDQTEDITYLASWSHSILAELGRLQALASDKAKGSFISSISHELRSPLHGILAGLEFLEETELTAFQTEMAHTIRSAGQALLDTVEHILDFSKISSFTRAQTRRRIETDTLRHKNSLQLDSAEIGVTASVDLALLSEEVIETIVNAHRFQKTRMASADVPSVDIQIQWRSNWTVDSMQPGSWTRILSNLVGNALKYTETGIITIKLESRGPVGDTGLEHLQLTVSDTGIGISREFLNRELYTPFKQADSHAQGTGLGLSIVKRICKDSGARLNITSELGIGTCAMVDFNARFESSASVSRALNVDRFHLFTPNKSTQNASRSIAPSVVRSAREWLDCETTQGPVCENDSGSTVYAISEDDLLTWISEKSARLTHASHVLVLGRSMHSVSIEYPTQQLPFLPIFVHQPIGPRKLLRAITQDQSSTGMRWSRPRSSVENLRQYATAATRPLSMERPPAGYFPWDKQPRPKFELSTPVPSPDQSAASSAVFSAAHSPSALHSATTECSNSIDSIAWPEATVSGASKDTVLLVEDNEVNLRLLMALMRKLDRKFLCAVNGREAVDVFRKNSHSILLILMDVSMPVMGGFESTNKIRETERKQNIPRCHIVALTGVTSDEAKQQAINSGMDAFYSKPVGMKEIRELLSRLQDGLDSKP